MNRTAAWCCSTFLCSATGVATLWGEVPFSDSRWTIEAQEHRIEQFDGRETLFLHNGGAFLDDVPFLDGVIEFEVMVVNERSFSGARWRAQDRKNYEDFYIRPHQSGKVDANQYMPVFNGVASWQIYYGAQYSVAATYPFGEWIQIRIEVLGDRAQMYIGDESVSLVVDDLKRETKPGGIGITSGWAPARFSRFRYEVTDELTIATPRADIEGDGPERKPKGLIREWSVSDAVSEADLVGKTRLSPTLMDEIEWHTLAVETNGIANLARVQGVTKDANTALVRLLLVAEKNTTQRLDIGFSDRIRAHVNGVLVYAGNDRWQSRDYRFLGTVGTYDALYLPLERGRNEVILAVSESFGGWAITGNLTPEPGVSIVRK